MKNLWFLATENPDMESKVGGDSKIIAVLSLENWVSGVPFQNIFLENCGKWKRVSVLSC